MKQVVAGIVIHENKILIGKKIHNPNHFLSEGWHIPGGGVQEGENKADALKREFKEETNLEIKIIEKIVAMEISDQGVRVHWYACTPITLEIIPGDDLTEAKFVKKSEAVEHCDIRATELWPEEVIKYLAE